MLASRLTKYWHLNFFGGSFNSWHPVVQTKFHFAGKTYASKNGTCWWRTSHGCLPKLLGWLVSSLVPAGCHIRIYQNEIWCSGFFDSDWESGPSLKEYNLFDWFNPWPLSPFIPFAGQCVRSPWRSNHGPDRNAPWSWQPFPVIAWVQERSCSWHQNASKTCHVETGCSLARKNFELLLHTMTGPFVFNL